MGIWKRIKLGLLIATLFAAAGCPSPAGPPNAPVELPSLVTFPQSVGIDVSQAGGGTPAAALVAERLRQGDPVTKAQTDLVDFSDIIAVGPITFNSFSLLLDDLLGPLSDLKIPVSPTVTNFEGPMTFAPGVVALVKIDFGDFDLDGDGTTEGCTGCTCPTGCAPAFTACPSEAPAIRVKPVCYRIWLRDTGKTEFARFSAGRIDRYATRDDPTTEESEESAGVGRFRMGVEPPPASDGTRTPLAFSVIYDHRDATDVSKKETEFFVQDLTLDASGSETERVEAHAFVTQEAPTIPVAAATFRKTVKLDLRMTPDPSDGPAIVQYSGRFLDDFDFWSGSFNLEDVEGEPPKKVSAENVCARISTGGEVAQANCLDLGIDVTGEAFLPQTQESDVSFPASFPEAPTF